MPDHPKCTTPGCAGDPTVPGTANRQCSRCYQWVRRHPNGPPPSAKPIERTGERVKVTVSLSKKTTRGAKAIAKRFGRELATWIRELVEREVAR